MITNSSSKISYKKQLFVRYNFKQNNTVDPHIKNNIHK